MKEKYVLPIVLMIAFALTRIPGMMPQNFSAAYAIAFCAGVYFSGMMKWWVPLGSLLLTDVLLNVYYYKNEAVSSFMIVNYIGYVLIIILGKQFDRNSGIFRLFCGGILGSIIFYLLTNTTAWVQNSEYTKDLTGWIQALTVGTPGWPQTWKFFRNTIMSGGLFTLLFVSSMRITTSEESTEEKKEPKKSDEPKESHEEAKV